MKKKKWKVLVIFYDRKVKELICNAESIEEVQNYIQNRFDGVYDTDYQLIEE